MEVVVEVQASVSAQCDSGGGESPSTKPRLPYTIEGLRDCASWIASFAAHFDYAAAAAAAVEAEKAAVAAEKASVEAKLRELGEREEDFEALGSFIDERANRVREVEEEAERKRKELEVKEKEIELKREELEQCLNRFRIREEGFEAQLDEFQVRLSELNDRESGIVEKERQCREKERDFEYRLDEFNRKVANLDLRLAELSKRGRGIDDREKGFRERFIEFEAKQMKFEESLRELEAKERAVEEREARNQKKLDELKAKAANFEEDLNRLGVKERGNEENEDHSKELQLEMKQQAEVARLIPAIKLRIKFPSASSPKDNQHSNLNPLLGNTFIAPTNPLDSRTSSGAKRSWSDASADGTRTESPDLAPVISADLPAQPPESLDIPAQRPDRLNVPAQQPERLDVPDQEPEMLNIHAQEPERSSSDQASCTSKKVPKHSALRNKKVPSPSTLLFVPKCLEKRGNSLILLCKKIKGNELYCREVSDALRVASDPAEFVLGVVKNPSSLTLKRGNEVARLAFPEYGPLLLLDCMWRMSPHVNPDVESEALSYARSWRSRFTNWQWHKNHLDTVCFLLFLAAYKLVSHFALDDLFHIFKSDCYFGRNGKKLLEVLGFKFLIPKSGDPLSGRLIPLRSAFPTNPKHSGLGNKEVPSPSTLLFVPTCIDMDEDQLSGNIWWQIEYNGLNCREVSDALELASDPGEFVLGVVKNPSSLTLKVGNEVVRLAFPRHGPLLLLDRMRRMSPHIKPEVEREALNFARSWKSDIVKQLKKNELDTACFMLFLAAYKLISHFDQDELLCLFDNDYHPHDDMVGVFAILGFKDLVSKCIEYLMRDDKTLSVLYFIKRSSLLDKSPSAKTKLKDMMHNFPRWHAPGIAGEIAAIDEEMKIWKVVVESIEDQHLAQSFGPHILALEKKKEGKLQAQKNREDSVRRPPPYYPKFSNYQLQHGQQQQRLDESHQNKRPRVAESRSEVVTAPPFRSNQNLQQPQQQPLPFVAPFRPDAAAILDLDPRCGVPF